MRPREGKDLVDGVRAQQIPLGALGIWFLNQFGYVFKTADGTTIYIDPYLSDALEEATRGQPDEHVRLFLPPVEGGDITNADYVFTTHEHLDHLDPKAVHDIAISSPGATFVAPPVCRKTLMGLGITAERIVTLPADQTKAFGSFRATATPGAHETFDLDPVYGYIYVGFILEFPGVTIWHSGDSVLFDGLADRVRPYKPDLAFLPINGRNYFKLRDNIRGNMGFVEAAELSVELGVDVVFPSHWGQHECNTENPGYFVDYVTRRHRGQRFRILAPGEGLIYAKDYTIE